MQIAVCSYAHAHRSLSSCPAVVAAAAAAAAAAVVVVVVILTDW